jgi:hypothetical protein
LVGPEVSERVPVAIVWLALVELVKVAYVPSPAIAAAAPRTASEAINLCRVEPEVKSRIDVLVGIPSAGPLPWKGVAISPGSS